MVPLLHWDNEPCLAGAEKSAVINERRASLRKNLESILQGQEHKRHYLEKLRLALKLEAKFGDMSSLPHSMVWAE